MILLDSNIVIYLRSSNFRGRIRDQLRNQHLHTCNTVVAEVLGYNYLEKRESEFFNKILSAMRNHPFDAQVTQKVIDIRKNKNIELPDAIIAATAITHDLILWTHNTKDFEDILGLKLYDPIQGLR